MTVVLDALGGKQDGCVLGEPTRRRPVLPSPAPPRRPALRRPGPFRPWYFRVLDSTIDLENRTRINDARGELRSEAPLQQFPEMPSMKRAYEDKADTKGRRSIGQQPGTKSVRGLTDRPPAKMSMVFVDSACTVFLLSVLPKKCPGRFPSDALEGNMGGHLLGATKRHCPAPPRLAQPRPAAQPYPVPPRP